MSPGMPGAGIGGIFYLLSAVLMPFRELYRTARGRSSRARWLGVARQTGIALTIIGSIWATGWVLGLLLMDPATGGGREGHGGPAEVAHATTVLGVGPLVAALLALGSVLLLVEAAGILRRGLRRRSLAR